MSDVYELDFFCEDKSFEEKLVKDVTEAFEHSVVVLNVGGMIDVSWIKSNPKISTDPQKPMNCYSNLEHKEQRWRHPTS